jgi:PadR family transcriptional regulator, regulatory protein PadR
MHADKLRGHLELLLLAAIGAGPSHGYAIAETLRRRSDGAFDLPDGTIYPALRRLEQRGLVASRWSDDTARRRRVYRLTPAGRRALVAEQHDWSQFARAVMGVVKGVA